ncbi:heat shock protein 86 family [Plasmodium gonderi]|uniref:Heat shock protein 86 family n=1 Tax=Plasmodium gonderi TaxID=77519 RepID=A0A1Y1J8T3_PLAGO|nr:heat shock protein 86 family [Plasmodium gonderi]GAW78921.1 heat shock protein 86 family [Plasmodium gonderi]
MSSDVKENDITINGDNEEDAQHDLKKMEFEKKHMELKEKLKKLKSSNNNSGINDDTNSADSEKNEKDNSNKNEITTKSVTSDNKNKFIQLREKLKKLKEECNPDEGYGNQIITERGGSEKSYQSRDNTKSNEKTLSQPTDECYKEKEPVKVEKDREAMRAELKKKLEKLKREYGIYNNENGTSVRIGEEQNEFRNKSISKGNTSSNYRKYSKRSNTTSNRSTSLDRGKLQSYDNRRNLNYSPDRNKNRYKNQNDYYDRELSNHSGFSSLDREYRRDYYGRVPIRLENLPYEDIRRRGVHYNPRRGQIGHGVRIRCSISNRDRSRCISRSRSRSRSRSNREREYWRDKQRSMNPREKWNYVRGDDNSYFRREEKKNRYLYNKWTGERIEKKYFRVPLGYHTTKENWNSYTQWLQKKNDYRFGLEFDENKIFRRSKSLSPSTWKNFVSNSEDNEEAPPGDADRGKKAIEKIEKTEKSEKYKKNEITKKLQKEKSDEKGGDYGDSHFDSSQSSYSSDKKRGNNRAPQRRKKTKRYSSSISSMHKGERERERSVNRGKKRHRSSGKKKKKAEKVSKRRKRDRSTDSSDESSDRDKKKYKKRKHGEKKREKKYREKERSEKKKRKKSKHDEKKRKHKKSKYSEKKKKKSKKLNKTRKNSEYSDSGGEESSNTSSTSLSFLCEGYDSLQDKETRKKGTKVPNAKLKISKSTRREKMTSVIDDDDPVTFEREKKDEAVVKDMGEENDQMEEEMEEYEKKKGKKKETELGTEFKSEMQIVMDDEKDYQNERKDNQNERKDDQDEKKDDQDERKDDQDEEHYEDSSGGESEVGPKPLDVNVKLAKQQIDYGVAMMPGEGQAIAQFVQKGKRIPRRGEVGLSAEAIENFESLGYVMSGSRHKRMNAIRMRKENQVYSAEEQRALAMLNYEERANWENTLINDLKEVLRKQNEAILNESKNS